MFVRKTTTMKCLFSALLILLMFSCREETTIVNEVSEPVRMGIYKSVIDTLLNPRSVELFLCECDTNYYAFQLRAISDFKKGMYPDNEKVIKIYAAKYHFDKLFYKADLDNNGYTDMLLIGAIESGGSRGQDPINLLVLNYGAHPVKVIPLTNGLFTPYLMPKLVVKGGVPLVETSSYEGVFENNMMVKRFISKTLTIRDSALIEYNPAPKNYHIEKIQFATSPCFGTCPLFEIHIDRDRNAIFLADEYNFSHDHDAKPEDKAFEAKIDTTTYNNICNMLYYLDFPSLEDNYSVDYTDAPSVQVIVTYNGGKQKKIEDYGLNGSFGLKQLYKGVKELRFNQKWRETAEPAGIRINTWYKKNQKQ